MTAAQAAALIAAIAFAVLAAAGVYTLIRLSRLIAQASRAVSDWRTRSDVVLGRASSAAEQAHEQLARTAEITAEMHAVSTNLAKLTADMSTLTRAARTLVGGPLGGLAGLAFGLRHAISLRRANPAAGRLDARRPDPRAVGPAPAARARQAALPGPGAAGQTLAARRHRFAAPRPRAGGPVAGGRMKDAP